MKKIIFVDNITEADIDKIAEILDDTRVEYDVVLSNKAIVLEGNNDIIHSAKVALKENGYKIN